MTDHHAGARHRRATSALAALLWVCVGACTGSEPPPASPALHENEALQELVTLQTARDARALVRLLDERDPIVRARAAFALGSVQDQGAAAALIERLEDESPAVRAEAAFALGQLPQGAREIENGLLAAVEREADPTARLRQVEALGKAGREAAAGWLASLPTSDPVGPDGTLALARTLARGVAPSEVVDTVLARLTDPDGRVRELAAWGLASALVETTWVARRDAVYRALDGYDKTEPAAVQLLRALLRVQDPGARERMRAWLETSPDWRIRAAAVEGLTAASAPADRAALIAALDDPSPHVRRAAAGALLGAPLEAAELDRIERWMRAHPDEWLVAAALMKTLVARGRGSAVVARIGSIPEDEPAAWAVALDAIALLPGEAATRALAEASRAPSLAISGAAARALALRWATEREGPEQHPLYYRAFARATRDRDPGLGPVLADLLSEAPFRALGSDSLLAAARALAAATPPALVQPDWAELGRLGDRPLLVLDTERGRVAVELFPDEAPLTVQTVARLAREGRYDGVPFHRVLPNFMAQGGDVARGDGLGEVGFRVPSELTHLRYLPGTVGMARIDKDSEGSQFFIAQSIQPHLDGGYGAFGRVVEGMDVVDALVEGDRIVQARIEPGPTPTGSGL
jgi:peptidylprolyl isomerase